jgi:hypothetical protein
MSLEDSINKLTVAVENLTQTITTLNAAPPVLAGSNTLEVLATSETTPAPDAEPETPKKSRKKAAAPVAEPAPEPAAEPEVVIVVEPEPAPALVAEPVKITLQDIRELAQVALDNDKLSGVIAINKKFGLRRISEATEDQYTEIHELLTKLTHGTS